MVGHPHTTLAQAAPPANLRGEPVADIILVGEKCTIWDPDAALRLRTQHRLIGTFVGKRRPGSKAPPTMPVMLTDEEASLAVSRGWGRLRRLRPAMRGGACADPGAGEDPGGDGQGGGEDQQPGSILGKRDRPEGGGGKVEIPQVPGGGDAELEDVEEGGWRFPETERERARAAVYRDLYERGYWLTGGLKFGADFLAYKGDPRAHHAEFMVAVAGMDEGLQPSHIVSIGRVGAAASKKGLIASVGDDGVVRYSTVAYSQQLETARGRRRG